MSQVLVTGRGYGYSQKSMCGARRPARLVFAVALFGSVAAAIAGCSSHFINRGWELYASGRYVEAAEVFERTQHRLDRAKPDDRALYGLYRGLTLMQLGDLRGASQWLTFSRDTAKVFPEALDPESRQVLAKAWFRLSQKLHETPAPPQVQQTAVAADPTALRR